MKPIQWGIVVIAILIIIGAVWYVQWPSRVVHRAVENLAQARTQQFTSTIELENISTAQQLLGEQGTVQITLDGAFERKEDQKDSLAAGVVLGIRSESVSVELTGQMRFVEDKAYLLIDKAPAALPVLARLRGQWVQLPRGGDGNGFGGQEEKTLFEHVNWEGRQEVNGQNALYYQAQANDTAVIRLMDNIAQLLGTRLSDQQIAGLRQNIGQVRQVPVEVWVTPWTHQLVQLRAHLDVPGGNAVSFTFLAKDQNKPVDIVPPSGAVTIEQALQQQ